MDEETDEWVWKRSDLLKVGSLIKIKEGDRIPADLILLQSSN